MIAVSAAAETVLQRLEAAGHRGYLVGGCVRDALCGRPIHDYDICTDAVPEQMTACFAGLTVVPTGLAHGTVTVVVGGEPVEVTTFRSDGAYADHRHPDGVRFVSDLREDLARRDFTVNAMAWRPDTGLIDPFGGQEDLRRGVLRCVGVPEQRLREDALRILRGMRFAARFDLTPEPATTAAMHALAPDLRHIAAERVWQELRGLLAAQDPGPVLLAFADVVGVILPELRPCVGFAQHSRYHCYDVYEHTVRAVCAVPPDEPVRLALLLHDCGKPAVATGDGHFYGHAAAGARLADAALDRLRVERALREQVLPLIRRHDEAIEPTEPCVRRALRRLGGEEPLRRLLSVQRGDTAAHAPEVREDRLTQLDETERLLGQVLAAQACFSLRDLAVGGDDLLTLGYTPGPALGRALQTLLDGVVDGTLPNEKEALLAAARQGKE